MSSLYEQLLLFPERAEFVGQFGEQYRVRLDHWRKLSAAFLDAFKQVHDRGTSAILLVHGAQGTGKTLFSLQLEHGFERTRKGEVQPRRDNLWHALVADEPGQAHIIQAATEHTALRRVRPESGWHAKERAFAREDRSRVRIFVLDDMHKDMFLREWAGLDPNGYMNLKVQGKEAVALGSVAQQLVEDCRGDFQRSIFLLLSNQGEMMHQLEVHLAESHRGLATRLELPLPEEATPGLASHQPQFSGTLQRCSSTPKQ